MMPRLRILIGGGTGFVGTALATSLRRKGHDVKIVSRYLRPSAKDFTWQNVLDPKGGDFTWDDIERDGLPATDAVINLAGSNMLDFKKLWTCKYKEECVSSRVSTTKLLAKAISESDDPPSVWISTSAVNFYPPSKEHEYDETVSVFPERDWASKLCVDIEDAADIPDPEARTRSVVMRTGIVLGQGGGEYDPLEMQSGGVYDKIRTPFYCCLGGTFGDGSQWFPYVHLTDVVRAYEFAILDNRPRGPLNLVAPTACTNKEFTKALGKAMWRPTIIPVPNFVSKLMGEERASILFSGQHVQPLVLTDLGFLFNYPDVTSCCRALAKGK